MDLTLPVIDGAAQGKEVRASIHTHRHTHAHTDTHRHTHTYTDRHTYTDIHTYTHALTRTHMRTFPRALKLSDFYKKIEGATLKGFTRIH